MESFEIYQLEKAIWTEKDFPQMGWSGNKLYSFATLTDEKEPWKNEVLFDIDYIFKWLDPVAPAKYFTYWVSPCTLAFKDCWNLNVNIHINSSFTLHLDIVKITMENSGEEKKSHRLCRCNIELGMGSISFDTSGFEQIVRKAPVLSRQWLDFSDRGGISFDKQPCII